MVKRLLVIGKQIKRLKCIEWSELGNHNLLDYQGLLLDLRGSGAPTELGRLPALLDQFMRNGHEIFVILPEVPSSITLFSPFAITSTPEKGRTLKIAESSQFINAYRLSLEGHNLVVSAGYPPVQSGARGWEWTMTISDNVSRAVCGRYGRAHILHPPAKRLELAAVRAILEYFSPTFEEPEPEERPPWATEVTSRMPGIAELRTRIEANANEIKRLNSEVEAHKRRTAEVEQWAELLWLEGIPLQNRVAEALKFLGLPTESTDPTGHLADLRATCGDREILFEVTGSASSVGVDKGRQLLQWVSQSDDPLLTKGVLVANAFRKNPPSQRPPSPDHKIFVKELEELATKFHIALVDVRELYDLVVQKLGGHEICGDELCRRLQGDGIIKLSADSSESSDPTSI
jgi:hypothetical protein